MGPVVVELQPRKLCSMNGPTELAHLEIGRPAFRSPPPYQLLAADCPLGGRGHQPDISSRGDTVAPATRAVSSLETSNTHSTGMPALAQEKGSGQVTSSFHGTCQANSSWSFKTQAVSICVRFSPTQKSSFWVNDAVYHLCFFFMPHYRPYQDQPCSTVDWFNVWLPTRLPCTQRVWIHLLIATQTPGLSPCTLFVKVIGIEMSWNILPGCLVLWP